MKLIFENSRKEERLIATVTSQEEAFKEIKKFIDNANTKRIDGKEFKSYYTRIWMEDDRKKFDVGSWSEFFYLELEDGEMW